MKRTILNAAKTLRKNPATNSGTVDLCVTTGRVSLRAAAGDGCRVFDLHAYTGGLVNLPQYDIPVVFDLSTMEMQDNATQVPLLKDHDSTKGVGHSDDVSIDANGVSGTGYMSVPSSFRDQIIEAADNGKEWQLSVGGSAPGDSIEYIDEGQSFRANNRGLQGPALLVRNYLLREISFVEAGADESGAIATLVASFHSNPKGEPTMFEKWLKSQGIDIKALTSEGLERLRVIFKSEQDAEGSESGEGSDSGDDNSSGDDASDDDTSNVDAQIAESAGTTDANDSVAESIRREQGEARAAEVERSEQLESLNARFESPRHRVGGEEVSMLATALRDGWTPERFELQALRQGRPQTMNASRSVDRSPQNRVAMLASMVFAIMGHANANVERDFRGNGSAREYLNATLLSNPNDAVRDRAMNQSHDFRYHDLIDMMATAMDLDGVDCNAPKKSPRWFKAAFSSNSVMDLFTQSTQAILIDSFMQEASTYDNFASICSQVDVPNYKENERKTLSPDSGELAKLRSTETARDATLSAGGEAYKISRFALRWGIDDMDVINEEFGVFRTMPRQLGMGAARLFGQVIAKLLLTNPNMKDGNPWFSGSNLRTGSALTSANMKAALTAFGTQMDGNVSLDLDPDTLFVPKALRFDAAEIFNDAPLITGTGGTQTSRNVLAGLINSIIHSALLDNGFNDPDDRDVAITPDPTSWYLFDSRYESIEVGHLQGEGRGPEIRTGEYTDGKYGVWFDIRRSLGAAPIRRESAQKNTAS